MPEFAKTYDFGDMSRVPTINDQEFPYYVSIDPGPMVQPIRDGHLHILWVPVQIDAPMPYPPSGSPEGEPITTKEPTDG